MPFVCTDRHGQPIATIRDEDACICFNYRADRVREITRALTRNSGLNAQGGNDLPGAAIWMQPFRVIVCPKICTTFCMTQYDKNFNLPIVIAPESMANILANVMGGMNLRNLRVAETEKYAHVTYFFNGGVEQPFPGEERLVVPSQKVATYDLKPEMSAAGIADAVVKATEDGTFDVVIVNFANADMVGHSGKIEPTVKAVEIVDACLDRIEKAVRAKGGAILITADHGNAEMLIDPVTGGPHTAHTTNPVPFIVIAEDSSKFTLKPNGSLRDISPTMLGMLGLDEPKEMTEERICGSRRSDDRGLMESRLIWINLLVKLGVAAAVSSSLVRSVAFKSLLFREERSLLQKTYLVLWFGLPITIGVWIRSATSFVAGDLSFETSLLLGVIGGRWAGVLGGVLMALPALRHGEWAVLPFSALCGFMAGQLRAMAADKDDIWSFSPFIDLSIYRLIRRNLPTPRLFDWQILFFATIIGLRVVQSQFARYFPRSIFSMDSSNLWIEIAIYAASVIAIGIELKIFNSVRIQIKLEEQERLLLHARMEALQNQINPHFLFNTLNSISSLVRFDPDTARDMITKLATILRRLLNSTDSFVPLREEVEFIDNYLGYRSGALRKRQAAGGEGTRVGLARRDGAEHAVTTAGGKFHQARTSFESRRRKHLLTQPAGEIRVSD